MADHSTCGLRFEVIGVHLGQAELTTVSLNSPFVF
jgi:hypothetical protein